MTLTLFALKHRRLIVAGIAIALALVGAAHPAFAETTWADSDFWN